MEGDVLQRSLGLTKEQIGEKFRHGTYDERVAGGGCLSLMAHFAEWCNLPSNEFTGHWDIGHRLQLVYADILKKSPDLSKFLKIVNTATSYCQGKDGLLLHELAMEMKVSMLADKSEQTTRWVRSLLRLVEAFYRNIQTICKFLGRLIEKARVEGDIRPLQLRHLFLITPRV